ncbi:MAG: hypothetical protein M5U34_08705 [Chloroflexi bacterium]|nr:hypothetical protein [Chloroflexota bacterium]
MPNEDAYNGSYRQISANTFPMCQSYWHIRPDAFTSPGAYDVFVHIPPGDNKSLGAEYTVRHNGRYLLIQYNCEAALFAVLQNVQTGKETTLARGYFLDWSPDGEWLLFARPMKTPFGWCR